MSGHTEVGRPLKSEVRGGMRIEWDVPLAMDDGIVLRADVYRPEAAGEYPVIMSYGPYCKGLTFQAGWPSLWERLVREYPDAVRGTSNRYQAWEVVDPEKWVPSGYAVVRVDSRGTGRSPGYLDALGAREARDYYDCIEWAGEQPWSNGRVGLLGISYYASNQWQVAAMHPPHLAAICPWEGFNDSYRDQARHGGILSRMAHRWYEHRIRVSQHGFSSPAFRNPESGLLATGDQGLDDDELASNRRDLVAELAEHRFDDSYHIEHSGRPEEIEVPLLSAANWGGLGLHSRGNFNGFLQAGSRQKWLEVHGGSHWGPFYTDYARDLQQRFFDHFLKGDDNGWDREPPVLLNVRHPDDSFTPRGEHEWPLARTEWRRAYLDPRAAALEFAPPAADSERTYRALGDGLTLLAAPFEHETEVTGPMAAKLWISSTTADADLFLVVRIFGPDGNEVLFEGANDPKTPVSQGWLRASHRRLDPERSTPWQPYHPHRDAEPLTPGQVYELDVEIWPTCLVIPAGYRLGLSVLGRDFDHGQEGVDGVLGLSMKGSGPFTHDDPADRPAELFDGEITVYGGGQRASYLLVPVIPAP